MISNNKNIVNIAVRIACNTRYKTGRKNTISNTAVSSQTRIIIIAISDTGYIVKRVHPGTVTSTQQSYSRNFLEICWKGKEWRVLNAKLFQYFGTQSRIVTGRHWSALTGIKLTHLRGLVTWTNYSTKRNFLFDYGR